MYQSIIISGKNTYTEWGIVPTSRPHIVPPEVKTSDVDLPSSHGVLDYTDLLLAETPYGQRKGSWEFAVKPGNLWVDVYSSILNYLHGIKHTVILEDDPGYLYTGRLKVNDWKSEERYSTITIDYNLDPFKYSVEASDDTEWQWNDLFQDVVRYGRFTVTGSKYRNLINRGKRPAIPTFTCSAPVSVLYHNTTYNLVTGKNYNANLALLPGDNEMLFTGNAEVTASYREVSL